MTPPAFSPSSLAAWDALDRDKFRDEREAVADGAQVVFKNISATELDFSAEEITDRFVRGDRSRNTEGSGLGLAIAKSFAELQGGTFSITVDGDLFKATVTLPDTNQPEQPETLPLPAAPDADAQSAPQTGGALPAGI